MNKPEQVKPEKMDLQSMDIAVEKRIELMRSLRRVFPDVFGEDAIEFDELKRVLGELVDPGKERFGLNWPGKAECMKIIQQPSIATLKPMHSESVNYDETNNVFIEGDNLEVIKLLQRAYFSRVKMIFIDPPYNTGGEFIYPDKYAETLDTYLSYTGQIDGEGKKFSTNTDSAGRYHSRWLSMMYPRLYLARNLLRDDGVIFVTIGDQEVSNLRSLMDGIFGEENFVSTIIWEKIYTTKNDSALISGCHDYILVYAKDANVCELGSLPRTKEMDARYTNPDSDPRGPWKPIPLYADGERKNGRFTIVGPTGRRFEPPVESHWRYVEADVLALIKDNRVSFGRDGTGQPNLKRFLSELDEGVKSKTIWFHKEVGSNDTANREIKSLFDGDDKLFSFPKPTSLIKRMIQLGGNARDAIVMDFFAGSASTAHAVMAANAEDGGQRRFLMVQLPEPTERKDFPTISDIAKERIRRAAKQIATDKQGTLKFQDGKEPDLGFRSFRLDRSNFAVWDGQNADELDDQIEMHIDHLSDESSPEDILSELLLKAGFQLTTKIEEREMAGKAVFSVEGGAMLICLDREITPELIDGLAEANPLQVICLDEGFKGNDQLKTNAVQTFKARAQAAESEIVFKTV
ncbi:site-specific DNA-methyltransferase [Tardiphaga robiniae]|uniref:site-specific DNA-methyltransferase n=1 Tax=Tardiphaga robiniae TaxID=943830 RepID=UPI001585D634|nr:site-specific DNA-methyltransferase [Tardiphaga robiniae]NUU41574.1 site-specific DNA-methyltransferase [Tardiphaga robiniae]